MGERFTLPVLPLRDTVVYPGVAVPISAGRPGTVEAVQEALDGDRRLFAVAQRENVDDPSPDVLYTVGTVVRIIQTHRVRGGVQLLVQGEGRAQALSYEQEGQAMLQADPPAHGATGSRQTPKTRPSRRWTGSCGNGPPSWAPAEAFPPRR